MVVFPKIVSAHVNNVRVVKDKVGLRSTHSLDHELSVIAGSLQGQFNAQFHNGWPLANINPTLGMIAGLLKNTTATPYKVDGWLYCGFEMQADLPTQESDAEFI
jgi:hypothetical protein